MKRYKIAAEEKSIIYALLREALENDGAILFVYIHGSFVTDENFNDIDIAIYTKDLPCSILDFELSYEAQIMQKLGKYLVDVRLLNKAPLSFKYNVLKNGILLFSKDEFLSDPHKISSAKYNFIVVIEGMIDLCNHIIAKNGPRKPEDYGDMFRIFFRKIFHNMNCS